jgi:hypothetical protein
LEEGAPAGIADPDDEKRHESLGAQQRLGDVHGCPVLKDTIGYNENLGRHLVGDGAAPPGNLERCPDVL